MIVGTSVHNITTFVSWFARHEVEIIFVHFFFTKKTHDRKWWPLWSRHRSNILAIIFEGSSYSFLFISCHSSQKEYIRSIMVTMKGFKKSMKIIPRRYPYYLDDLMNGALQGVAPRVRMDRCAWKLPFGTSSEEEGISPKNPARKWIDH